MSEPVMAWRTLRRIDGTEMRLRMREDYKPAIGDILCVSNFDDPTYTTAWPIGEVPPNYFPLQLAKWYYCTAEGADSGCRLRELEANDLRWVLVRLRNHIVDLALLQQENNGLRKELEEISAILAKDYADYKDVPRTVEERVITRLLTSATWRNETPHELRFSIRADADRLIVTTTLALN